LFPQTNSQRKSTAASQSTSHLSPSQPLKQINPTAKPKDTPVQPTANPEDTPVQPTAKPEDTPDESTQEVLDAELCHKFIREVKGLRTDFTRVKQFFQMANKLRKFDNFMFDPKADFQLRASMASLHANMANQYFDLAAQYWDQEAANRKYAQGFIDGQYEARTMEANHAARQEYKRGVQETQEKLNKSWKERLHASLPGYTYFNFLKGVHLGVTSVLQQQHDMYQVDMEDELHLRSLGYDWGFAAHDEPVEGEYDKQGPMCFRHPTEPYSELSESSRNGYHGGMQDGFARAECLGSPALPLVPDSEIVFIPSEPRDRVTLTSNYAQSVLDPSAKLSKNKNKHKSATQSTQYQQDDQYPQSSNAQSSQIQPHQYRTTQFSTAHYYQNSQSYQQDNQYPESSNAQSSQPQPHQYRTTQFNTAHYYQNSQSYQ
jgi:hypothetical protein